MTHAITRRPSRHDVEAEIERMLAMGQEIPDRMGRPVSYGLSDRCGENGFTGDAGDFSRTDIEPALKD